jgi:hypothetical protein
LREISDELYVLPSDGCDHHQAIGKLMALLLVPSPCMAGTSPAVKKIQKNTAFLAKTSVWLILLA